MNLNHLHDAEVVGILWDRARGMLELRFSQESGETATVRCEGVVGFELDGFRDQNIVFTFSVRTVVELPGELQEEILSFCADAKSRELYCAELDPSVGLGGWILASRVEYLD